MAREEVVTTLTSAVPASTPAEFRKMGFNILKLKEKTKAAGKRKTKRSLKKKG